MSDEEIESKCPGYIECRKAFKYLTAEAEATGPDTTPTAKFVALGRDLDALRRKYPKGYLYAKTEDYRILFSLMRTGKRETEAILKALLDGKTPKQAEHCAYLERLRGNTAKAPQTLQV